MTPGPMKAYTLDDAKALVTIPETGGKVWWIEPIGTVGHGTLTEVLGAYGTVLPINETETVRLPLTELHVYPVPSYRDAVRLLSFTKQG